MRKLLAVIMLLLAPAAAHGAFGDFTVTMPAGSEVTMGDSTDTLSFTVTNDAASTRAIRTLFFNIDTTLYNFSAAQSVPTTCAGTWSFQDETVACALPGCVSFSSNTGIGAGESCTFDLVLNGPNDGLFVSDIADITTDTLSSVVASKDLGASQQAGDFTLVGGLPNWTRRALAITMSASPVSVGVGDAIAVSMDVTNRSSTTQSGITSIPSPPSRTYTGGAAASLVGSAVYGSSSLTTNPPPATLRNDADASQTTITVFDTSGFPSSGRILVDVELMDYSALTGDSFTGLARGVGGTSAAAHDKWATVYSQNTSAFALDVWETATVTWIFSADSAGTVYFSARGSNSAGTATSKSASTNSVVIGDFTAVLSIEPSALISGQTVDVTMTVANNGSTALTNVTPSALTPGGTAAAALVSGPEPASIATLNVGESGTFQWTYQITGSQGQTYNFTGSATSDTASSNTHTSDTGEITTYAVYVNPSTTPTGVTSFSPIWTVWNNGAVEVKEVQITIPPPLTSLCGSPYGWGYQGDVPPVDWTSSTLGTPVTDVVFTSGNPVRTKGILVGQSKDFQITFDCVPQVTSDTTYNFPVTITDKNNNTVTVETEIVVTAYQLDLAVFDDDCTSPPPASKAADGLNQYCFVATLTVGGSAAEDEVVDFSITSGLGSLSASSALTDSNGQATVYLTAPCSTSDVSTTVEAAYGANTSDAETVDFTAVSGGVLTYVPGSLTFNRSAPPPTGDINPVSIDTGDTGVFRLDLMNCGDSALTVQTADSSLAVRTGSPDTFNLSGAVFIDVGATETLTFDSGTIAEGALQCYPVLTANAGSGYTGPFSFYKSPSGDSVGDTVTISGGTACGSAAGVRILDWRELY